MTRNIDTMGGTAMPKCLMVATMKNVYVKTVLHCMLAAWMLLATSITSSAYVHVHNGGSVSHGHDRCDSTTLHSSVATKSYDGHHHGLSLPAQDAHCHGCLVLLGAVTYQPLSDKSSASHDKLPMDWQMTPVVSAAQSTRGLSKNLAIDRAGLASTVIVSIDHVYETNHFESFRAGAVLFSPLCDRARHERSGVLLA
jgi:hypothetical protein